MKSVFEDLARGVRLLSARGKRFLIIYCCSLGALSLLDAAALILFSRVLVNMPSGSFTELSPQSGFTFLAVFILFMLRTLLSTLASWFAVKELAREEVAVGQRNFFYALHLPWSINSTKPITYLYNTVDQGPSDLIQGLLLIGVSLSAEVFTLLIILGSLFWLQPLTATLALLYFSFVAILQHSLLSKSSARAGENYVEYFNKLYSSLSDVYSLIKPLYIMSSTSLSAHIEAERRGLATSRARTSFLAMLPRYFMESILAIGVLVIAAITYMVGGASQAISSVALFGVAGFRLLPIVNRIQGLVLQLISVRPRAKHAFVDLGLQIPSREETPPTQPEIAISFNGVDFSYSVDSPDILKNINLSIPLGKQIAIIGPSGSGKTTIGDLCLNLLQPVQGTIFRSPQMTYGYVPQETHIAKVSLAQNVALEWDVSRIDFERVESILDQVDLGKFNLSLKARGAETEPLHQNLSGGEKQRIGLARALYRNPDFLVLDEFTSSLDGETEKIIMQTIRGLNGRTTVLIIAHRMSTIIFSDQIYLIEQGEIIEVNRDELNASTNSKY